MKTPIGFLPKFPNVGEQEHWFLVFVRWERGGEGGAERFDTLEEAQASVKKLQSLGYDKMHSPVQIFEMTRKRIR